MEVERAHLPQLAVSVHRASVSRSFGAALLIAAAAALGLASVTLAADPAEDLLSTLNGTVSDASEAVAPVAETAAPAIGTMTTTLGPALAAVDPLLDPVFHATGPAIEPVRSGLEPILERARPSLDAAAPLIDAVAPVVEAAEPIVTPLDPIVGTVDPTTPAATPSGREGVDPLAANAAAPRTGTTGSPVVAGDVGLIAQAFGTISSPGQSTEFLPHGSSTAVVVGGWARHAVTAIAAGLADAATAAAAGSGIAAAILLAILLAGPPSWRASLHAALARPPTRAVAVLVPPG
jgi:hypothetical protein